MWRRSPRQGPAVYSHPPQCTYVLFTVRRSRRLWFHYEFPRVYFQVLGIVLYNRSCIHNTYNTFSRRLIRTYPDGCGHLGDHRKEPRTRKTYSRRSVTKMSSVGEEPDAREQWKVRTVGWQRGYSVCHLGSPRRRRSQEAGTRRIRPRCV